MFEEKGDSIEVLRIFLLKLLLKWTKNNTLKAKSEDSFCVMVLVVVVVG